MYRLIQGDVLERLREMEEGSVQMAVTSPPYWGLRDYKTEPLVWGGQEGCEHVWGDMVPQDSRHLYTPGNSGPKHTAAAEHPKGRGCWCERCGAWRGSLGLEPTPEMYVEHIVQVFREVRRVLRKDGTVWLNLGDSFASQGGSGAQGKNGQRAGRTFTLFREGGTTPPPGLKPKDLIGIPWRVALALQADGWWLRSDIIWCLSGGTVVYARTQKGDMPMTIRDLARLKPGTVKLWNGTQWTPLLGVSKSKRDGTEIEIVLRSGERISCTPTHRFSTQRGLLAASDISVGDVLQSCRLPEPESVRDCAIDEDAAWFAGLYVAEGSMAGDTIQIAGHAKEEERWARVQAIAAKYGGSATRTVSGNSMNIRMYGKVLRAILDEMVSGHTAHDKCFAPVVWRYSNTFVAAMIDGYLAGDGHIDSNRWRLGFFRNYNLERDLRTACARLGYSLVLKMSHVKYNGGMRPTFRGELRKTRSGHHNERPLAAVVEIRKARCREVYDLGVEDDPHLFALASGVLTHNSKPNPMPESVTDRPTKAHEYLFLLAKSERYYYNAEAVKEPLQTAAKENYPARAKVTGRGMQGAAAARGVDRDKSGGFPINGSGRNRRSVWTIPTRPYRGAHFATFPPALVEPCILAGCPEGGTVLDPFAGSGTTLAVAERLGRNSVGIELNPSYIGLAEERIAQTRAKMGLDKPIADGVH